MDYTMDSLLLTGEKWSGMVNGRVTWTYDDHLHTGRIFKIVLLLIKNITRI